MRIADENKILRVKEEAKKLIVEKGYHGASIAEIAKRAGVSDGYLYRHHKNKLELATYIFVDLLKEYHDFIFDLIEKYDRLRPIVEGIVYYMFELDKRDPQAIRYTYSLIYDVDFIYPESRDEAINKMCTDILELGKRTGEIGPHIRKVDVLLGIFTLPIKYTEYLKIPYYQVEEKYSPKDLEHIVNMCMNAVK